jgi:hypothetical protein
MPQIQRHSAGSQQKVNDDSGEGVAIANLIGTDGCSVVGWVYRWSTGSHAVMWDVHGPQPVSEIRPDLTEEQKQEIDFDGLRRIGSGDSK